MLDLGQERERPCKGNRNTETEKDDKDKKEENTFTRMKWLR